MWLFVKELYALRNTLKVINENRFNANYRIFIKLITMNRFGRKLTKLAQHKLIFRF
jgi:hypothetical protein